MGNFGGRTRSIALLVVGIILVVSGTIVGVAGNILILGTGNDARAGGTTLTSTTAGDALLVAQAGNGVAIHGVSEAATGIAGLFTSAAGTAAIAIVGDANGFAIRASNGAEAPGRGGAIHASGRLNAGIVAESLTAAAIMATASGASPAIVAQAPYRTAIKAAGSGGSELEDCVVLFCAGTESTGAIGVIAGTATANGSGVYAVDNTPDESGFALVAKGDTVIDGRLSVTGGCIGCTSLAVARNGSDGALRQGRAVRLLSLEIAPDGSTVLVVGLAGPEDRVIGVVDRAIILEASPARSAAAGGWRVGEAEASAGGDLRIATDGMLLLELPLLDVPAGAQVVSGDASGRLVEDRGNGGTAVGTYLGQRPDGKGVLLIDLD